MLGAAIPYLPPASRLPAESCRQVAVPPPSPWRFYTLRRRRGERSALSPIPRCWVSSRNRTDVQTPPERRDVRPPLLPPRAGNGPNSALGPAGIERAAATAAPPGLCRRGDAAVGRRMGPRGRAEGCGRMERVCRFGASRGARASPGTFPGVRGRSHPHTHPCGDGVALKMGTWSPAPRSHPAMPRCGGSSRPAMQWCCGPRTGLRPAPSESCDSAAC